MSVSPISSNWSDDELNGDEAARLSKPIMASLSDMDCISEAEHTL